MRESICRKKRKFHTPGFLPFFKGQISSLSSPYLRSVNDVRKLEEETNRVEIDIVHFSFENNDRREDLKISKCRTHRTHRRPFFFF
jgi:hypothetical protein